jgi:hypothetical protein
MSLRPFLILATILAIFLTAVAQTRDASAPTAKPAAANSPEKSSPKTVRELEAERLLKERRANAQSLLISLAADARSFNDAVTRGRTLARVANVIWDADRERARTMFRLAWDAAEIADKEDLERSRVENARPSSGPGLGYPVSPWVRREVMRLAARRERALGEEFLARMKEQIDRDNDGAKLTHPTELGLFDPMIIHRMDVARQLLEADDLERALQFADPVLGVVNQWTVDFLSSVRERNAVAADTRYAAMLASAAANPQSEANTASVLTSYLFTPHVYIGYSVKGSHTNSYRGNYSPPQVSPELRLAFFRTAAAILLRPLAPPGEENTTAGHDGHYLVIKRLMPLFEQYAPPELTAAVKGQMESLTALITGATRNREDDDWVKTGIRPDNMEENYEKSLFNQLEHAKTSTERDSIDIRLAMYFAADGNLRARDFIDDVADPETRTNARTLTDIRLAERAIAKKDIDRMIDLIRTGEFSHAYKVWLATQAAQLLAKSDNEKAAGLVELGIAEARRISPSEVEAPRAFVAAANAMFTVNRAAIWEPMNEAVKAANSTENFTGEDGELSFRVVTKAGPSHLSYNAVPDFNLEGIFKSLADYDYDKAVQLARGLNRDAPRSVATIAIARAVLEPKKK